MNKYNKHPIVIHTKDEHKNFINVDTNGKQKIDLNKNSNIKIKKTIEISSNKTIMPTIEDNSNQIQKNAEYAAKNRLIITIGLAIISVIILLSIIFYSQPSPIPKIKSKGNVQIDMSRRTNIDIDSNISVDGSAGKSSSNSGTIEDKSISWFTPWNIIKQLYGWLF